jgi:hypothetical protein
MTLSGQEREWQKRIEIQVGFKTILWQVKISI